MQGLKYTATRMDIVNDFYNEIQKLREKYDGKVDAMAALEEIEGLAIWWANTPVCHEEYKI